MGRWNGTSEDRLFSRCWCSSASKSKASAIDNCGHNLRKCSGWKKQQITPGKMSYDLRRPRLHGLIERIGVVATQFVTDSRLCSAARKSAVRSLAQFSYLRDNRTGIGALDHVGLSTGLHHGAFLLALLEH